ncbi:MAG: PbpA [Desulfobacteraceae bacterium]|nr:MAG: PbpA [Desulfobacteraceae bacterium]
MGREMPKVMNLFKKAPLNAAARPSWRDYQNRLNRSPKRMNGRRPIVWILIAGVVFFLLYLGFSSPGAGIVKTAVNIQAPNSNDLLISKKDVQLLLQRTPLNDLLTDRISLPFKTGGFLVETSIDRILQDRLVEAMDLKNSRFIGIVVMEADSGKVLTLAGYDKTNSNANPCLQSTFPAASLFKIVTAAAAIDHHHFSCETPVRFNGYKHTLYKSQLQDSNNAYTHTISFADSFAQSINPVFGKIGKLNLGKQVLEQFGQDFGFNQPIDFELPISPSRLAVEESSYHWAEIASGFNNDTTISPVHAAMMVSAVLNQGLMVNPTVVARIVDAGGREIYRSQASAHLRAMSPRASSILAQMMETTVKSGTARGVFKSIRRDSVLAKLRIGGKTGSIYNRTHDTRFDWFVGYAEAKDGPGRLIVAALVGHEEYIGTRAGTYARMAMNHYFNDYMARKINPGDKTDI